MNHPEEKIPTSNQERLSLNMLIDSLSQLASQQTDPDVELIELKAGEVLFEQGDAADRAYLLIAGVLGVRVRQPDGSEREIDKLAPGAVVGELALLSGQERTATVYAVNPAGLISLSKSRLEQLSAGEQEAIFEDKVVQERTRRLQLSQILTELVGDFDTAALHALQSKLEWKHLSQGEILFDQGEGADDFYILISGRLGVAKADALQESRLICEIYPGETVGEYAMINSEVRPARVIAEGDSEVVRFPRPVFEHLAADHPGLMVRLARRMFERQEALLLRVML